MGALVEKALSLLQEDKPHEARALLAQWVVDSPQDSRGLELLALAERLARDAPSGPEFSQSELRWFAAGAKPIPQVEDEECDSTREAPRYRPVVFAVPTALMLAVASGLWLSTGPAQGSGDPAPSPAPAVRSAAPKIASAPAASSRPSPKRLLTSAEHPHASRRHR
jgi:hypothetical protein